jgi:hypothetical protein
MAAVNYRGTLAFGASLTFTPAEGDTTTISLDAIHEVTPPTEEATVAKYTPIDGPNAGYEQVVAGKHNATQSTLKVTYLAERYEDLAALFRVWGVYLLTLNDGTTITASGFMSKIGLEVLNDTAMQVIAISFELEGGWTPVTPGETS